MDALPSENTAKRYALPGDVKRFCRQGKVVLINRHIPSWIVTDSLGELILSLFDGLHSVQDVQEIAVEALGDKYLEKIQKFCSYAIASRIFEEQQPTRRHRLQLSMVHLSLSEDCNLNCVYCYAKERKEREHRKVGLSDYIQVIDDILRINPNCGFTITGGEPLLNPLWKDISSYIRSRGAYSILLTNGTLINESNIDIIRQNFSLVTLSVDGSTAPVHSRTRGNNLHLVERAIHLLESRGVDYSISMTVTKTNIHDVAMMAKKYGNRLSYAPLFPVNDSLRRESIAITGMEYFNALKNAAGVAPLAYCESTIESAKHSRCYKCAVGDGEISISATGDVYPCQLLHTPEFYAGNILDNPINEIYQTAPSLIRCSNLNVDDMAGCKDCAFKYICGGSCRARAYYETGSVDVSGDFCIYEQEAFIDGILGLYSENSLLL